MWDPSIGILVKKNIERLWNTVTMKVRLLQNT